MQTISITPTTPLSTFADAVAVELGGVPFAGVARAIRVSPHIIVAANAIRIDLVASAERVGPMDVLVAVDVTRYRSHDDYALVIATDVAASAFAVVAQVAENMVSSYSQQIDDLPKRRGKMHDFGEREVIKGLRAKSLDMLARYADAATEWRCRSMDRSDALRRAVSARRMAEAAYIAPCFERLSDGVVVTRIEDTCPAMLDSVVSGELPLEDAIAWWTEWGLARHGAMTVIQAAVAAGDIERTELDSIDTTDFEASTIAMARLAAELT